MLQIFVFFADDGKVGVNVIKTFAERIRSESVGRAIMVSQSPLTPFAKQCVHELTNKFHLEPVCYSSVPLSWPIAFSAVSRPVHKLEKAMPCG